MKLFRMWRNLCAMNTAGKKKYIYIWLVKLFPCRLDAISQSSRAVTSALAFISSCANPVLYTFAGKSYIKKNGFAFMAKLFEGTLSDQTGTKSTQLTTYDNVGESNVDCQNPTVASTPENRNLEWTSTDCIYKWKHLKLCKALSGLIDFRLHTTSISTAFLFKMW